MHSMIHKGCKTQADLDSDVTEYVRKQFDSVVVKQVFASRPSPTIVTQLGKIFSAFAFRAFEFFNPKVVRAGHIKAGWGSLDGQVDWDIMIRRYSFQLNQDDAARLKGTVAPVLQKEIWTNSQISEEVFDDNQVPRSAKEEKDFEENRVPRDQRTTSERRAVIMLTKEAQAARKKEVETREAHFESKKKQNEEKYAKKVQKQEAEKRKQEAASAAQVAEANYEVKRLLAVLASQQAEGKADAAPCALCGILLSVGKAHDLGEKWVKGWTTCKTKNCNEAWCSDCIKRCTGAYSNHRRQKHPTKKRKASGLKTQEAQVVAAQAKLQKLVEANAKQQNGYDAGEVTADAQFPPQILHPKKSVDQLLLDPEFRKVVANALEVPAITTKVFTQDELESAKSVVEVMRFRLEEKLQAQSAAVKEDVLWKEYVEPNLPRIVAIKVLQGIVVLNRRGLLSTTTECLLLPPDQSTIKEIFTTSPRGESWGSYLVFWDGKFRRSGKRRTMWNAWRNTTGPERNGRPVTREVSIKNATKMKYGTHCGSSIPWRLRIKKTEQHSPGTWLSRMNLTANIC